MNKNDFYLTAIKLLGAYLFITNAYNLVSFGLYSFEPWPEDMKAQKTLYMAYQIVPLVLAILIINKAGTLVRMLGLTGQTEDEGSVHVGNWDSKRIAEFALLLLSGYLILTNLVPLIMSIVSFFADSVSPQYQVGPGEVRYVDQYSFFVVCVEILLGGIIITNVPWFVGKIVGKYSSDEDVSTPVDVD